MPNKVINTLAVFTLTIELDHFPIQDRGRAQGSIQTNKQMNKQTNDKR